MSKDCESKTNREPTGSQLRKNSKRKMSDFMVYPKKSSNYSNIDIKLSPALRSFGLRDAVTLDK